jgi:glycosyltransferase involved in cell wall biosynthesis
MRLGIIARSDNTGLGNQTRELVNMLTPSKVMLIDSTPFNKNKQHPEWYQGYETIKTNGFPTKEEIVSFLENLDVVISCETFYDQNFVKYAKRRNVKTILQYNYELFGSLSTPELPVADVLLAPSSWNINHVKKLFGSRSNVMHLPPPTNPLTFINAKETNMSKDHNRILHIAGRKAAKDRNGTDTVLEMLRYSKADYQLVIRSQNEVETNIKDSRLTIEVGNPDNREDMYTGFDAMILPRRYAGLCLPMNEALLSGLPVFMTDISPNNEILPANWLVKSSSLGTFRTKVRIEFFEANRKDLALCLDNYISLTNKQDEKEKAFAIGFNNFSNSILKDKWLEVISQI